MFSLFKKDPSKKLKKQYAQKLEQAMHAQRNGDMKSYAALATQAEAIHKQILALENP